MNGWRFLPLAENVRFGVVASPEGKPWPARFLTPEEAKDAQQSQKRIAA